MDILMAITRRNATAPDSRSGWHVHGGMYVIGVGGVGLYQEEGKPAIIIRKGDVIQIPAGVKLSTGTAMAAYGIYDVSGMFLGRIEAAGLSDVKAKASELVRNGGMFIAKPVNGGKVFRFAVTK